VTETIADPLPFLDLADPAFSTRSEAVRAARARHWCARTPYGLAVLRHAEAGALLRDRRLRQGSHAWPAHQGVTGRFADWWGRILLNREGEDHRRLRALVNPSFAPGRVARLEPGFEAIAGELADGLLAAGEADFMAAFARPYAARAIRLLLGLGADWRALAHHASEMGLALGVEYARHRERVEAAFAALRETADALVAARGDRPGEDFVSDLLAREAEGAMTAEEVRDMIVLAIFGGVDTTTAQLGLAVATLMERPADWRRLAAEPGLVPAAVEEVMRLRPTTTWVTREAVEDLEIGGVRIPAGTTLHLLTESAGTDPAAYPEAGFSLEERRRAHFGFGGGRHHCLGSHLARADMAVALRVLTARCAPPEPAGPAEWLPESGNTGPARLPLRLRPA
jgi:cytochrome P450